MSQNEMWRTAGDLVEIGFERSRVVMMNEAHNGLLRCVRTREVGRRILPTAQACGVRVLAMEALTLPIAEAANRTRRLPDEVQGYLAQADMQALIQAALDLGWRLAAYEADMTQLLRERFDFEYLFNAVPDAETEKQLQVAQAFMTSAEATNWREEQQARNLATIVDSLEGDARMLVWCGNGHHSKVAHPDWTPMGYHFREISGIDPFVIDQNVTVLFPGQEAQAQQRVTAVRAELEQRGGTAGFLAAEAPDEYKGLLAFTGDDAVILSVNNAMV